MGKKMIKLAEVTPDHSKYTHVCADTETTGVDKYSEVIEIACTEFNLKGEIGATIHYMCEPLSGYIPAGASKVNNIFMEDVKGCPTYIKGGVRLECAEFIGDRIITAHNAPFDIRMMRLQFDDNKIADTLKLAKAEWPRGRVNLKACISKIGREWDDEKAHRATYDVEKCIELLLYLNNGNDRRPEFL